VKKWMLRKENNIAEKEREAIKSLSAVSSKAALFALDHNYYCLFNTILGPISESLFLLPTESTAP